MSCTLPLDVPVLAVGLEAAPPVPIPAVALVGRLMNKAEGVRVWRKCDDEQWLGYMVV